MKLLKKANRILDLMKRNISFKNKGVVVPVDNSFVRPHME